MKKYLKSFFVLSILFVALFAVVFSTGCGENNPGGDKPDDNVEFVDQGEVGTYYSYAYESEVKITLDQNKFTLKLPKGDLKGTYTYDGNAIVITFEGDASGVNAQFDKSILSFTYKGTSYTLYRDVDYAVSFNTNGGSAVANVNVKNGKTVTKPADPTKEGYQFIGWYKDSGLKTLFDFDSEIITENATIYARFEEKTSEADEFVVSFNTGIDGVQVDNVLTFHKSLINLPTVSAEGKTFLGWWYSSYNDGTKLSYQYESGMEITENITLFAVYADAKPIVSIANGKISWDNKGVNKQYAVNIYNVDDVDGDPIYAKRVTSTFVEFDFDAVDAGNYKVTVTCGDNIGEAYYANKQLAKVTKVNIEGFKITWAPVADAKSYQILVECGNPDHKHKLTSVGTATEYDFSACDMKADGIKFTIYAVAEDYLTSTSDKFSCYYELAKVTNIAVDEVTQVVTWDAVDKATGYLVTVKAANDRVYSFNTESATLDVQEFYGNIEVTVTPVAKGYYSFETKQDLTKTSLVAPKNIVFSGYEVRWDAVTDAVSYNIKIGDKSYTSTTNSYTLSASEVDAITDFKITVQAVAQDAKNNSFYSAETIVDKSGVTVIDYKNGVITWNAVPGISKYAVKVDGATPIIVNTNSLEYKTFEQAGKHSFEVTTADNNGNYGTFTCKIEKEVYALKFDTLGGSALNDMYYVDGDSIGSLPQASYSGYTFQGWYTSEDSGTTLNALFTASQFNFGKDYTVYATYKGNEYTAKLDYAVYGTGDVTEKKVIFGSNYTLPVPTTVEDNIVKAFVGWYSQKNGQGERYTDEFGVSVREWRDFETTTLYAAWVDVFTFNPLTAGGYSVSKGPGIGYVTNITIPATYEGQPVKDIEGSAFQSCSKLVVINIPNTIQNIIGLEAGPNGTGNPFQSCSALQAVNIYEVEGAVAEDVKYYSVDGVVFYKNAFNGGDEIKYFPYNTKGGVYTIPSTVTVIPTNAFRSCTKLEEVIIPASVEKIDDSAFYGCSKLRTITFLNAEEGEEEKELVLGSKVFQSNSALISINLPARLGTFNVDVFASCSSLTDVNILGNDPNAKYASFDGVLLNADKTEIIFCPRGKTGEFTTFVGVNSIAENAFDGCKNLYKVTITGQVGTIKEKAFNGCSGITELVFTGTKDDTPLSIGKSAFYGCSGLTTLVLPENLVGLEVGAFGNTSKLTDVTVTSTNRNIDFKTNAFGTVSTSSTAIPTFYVTDLHIGKAVNSFDITGVFGAIKLVNVDVDPENANYSSKDGVLYNKDITAILYYPTEKEGNYVLEPTITAIGDRVFQSRTGITSITIHKNVTSIGVDAFRGANKLETVIFEEGGTQPLTIANGAFYSCTALLEANLPARVVSIGENAFRSCTKLLKIDLPEGLTSIGDSAFYQCNAAQYVAIPSTLTVLPETTSTTTNDKEARVRLFDYTTHNEEFRVAAGNPNYKSIDGVLYKIVKDDNGDQVGLELLSFPTGKGGKIDLPSNVVAIANHAFYYNKNIEEVTFSNGVDNDLTIGVYAFYWCEKLRKVELPRGLTEISTNAFYYDQKLEEVVIPNTVTKIGKKAFYYCQALDKITFEEGGTAPLVIEDGETVSSGSEGVTYTGTFYGCNKLESIVLPERLERIGKYAFTGYYSGSGGSSSYSYIKSISIPASVKVIDDYAFYHCEYLTDVNFYGGESQLETLGTYAFAYTPITSVVLPEGMETTSTSVFYQCKELTSVSIPSTLKTISNSMFSYCAKLANVTLAANSQLESIGTYAFQNAQIESFVVPKTCKVVDNYAFSGCKKLASFTFDGGNSEEGVALTRIGQYAFQNTALTEFRFPYCGKDNLGVPNKITIGTTATNGNVTSHLFAGCKKLTTVYISEAVVNLTNLFVKCSSIKNVIISDNSENFKVDANNPIILDLDGKSIQFIFGRASGVFEIPEGVQEISNYAFSGQVDITKVIIPASMKTIGQYAFFNCANLEEVQFKDGCVCDVIGDYAFQNCRKLRKINLPNNLVSIGKYLFNFCVSLSDLTMSPNVNTINSYAFANCRSLTEFTIGSKVTKVDMYAFYRCNGLTQMYIPASVTTWGTNIFRECANLETVTFADTAKLSNYMFYGCTSLKNVTLPAKLTAITTDLFENCTGLESITIPKTVQYIGSANKATASGSAFLNCTSLKNVTFEEGSVCKTIAYKTFAGCTSLTSIELPAGLTNLGNAAFLDCTSLESIVIPNTVTKLGQTNTTSVSASSGGNVFQNCTSLKSIDFGTGVTAIYSYVFENTGFTEITIPSKVTILGNYALANCENLEKADIQGKLATVGTYIFANDAKLSDVTILKTNTTFGNYMFSYCSSLESIDLPTSLTNIGTYTFQYSGLKSIKFPATLTKLGTSYTSKAAIFLGCDKLETVDFSLVNTKMTLIGAGVFQDCTALKSVTLPSALTTTGLGNYAFQNTGLTSIVIPSKVTNIGSAAATGDTFKDCKDLTSVTIGSAVKYIYGGAFDGCTSLTNITIPSSVTAIGKYAFRNTGLTSINIPKSVTTIGAAAFNRSDNLTQVTTDSSSKYQVFDGCALVDTSTNTIVSVFGAKGDYVIPEGTLIGQYAFEGCGDVTSVTLPNSMTNVTGYAFSYSDIKKVILAPTTTTLASYAFVYSNVEEIEGTENLEVVNTYAFRYTTKLKTVNFSDKLQTLAGYAFQYATGLESIEIPGSVKTLGTYSASSVTSGYVFQYCENLKTVKLNEGLEDINAYSFDSSGVTSLEFPSTVKRVGNYIASKCPDLTSVTFNGVAQYELGTYSFQNDTALKTVVLPQGITKIPTYTFVGCTALESVNIPTSVTLIDTHSFEFCESLKSVTLPQGLVTIQTNAFNGCGLESIEIPASVQNIFAYGFANNVNLKTVVLNEGIVTLGVVNSSPTTSSNGYVFQNCEKLESINLPSTLEQFGSYTFANCTSLKTLFIPDNVIYVGGFAFQGWTSDQRILIESSRFDITNSWYESATYSTDAGYWSETEAQFVWEYEANA